MQSQMTYLECRVIAGPHVHFFIMFFIYFLDEKSIGDGFEAQKILLILLKMNPQGVFSGAVATALIKLEQHGLRAFASR